MDTSRRYFLITLSALLIFLGIVFRRAEVLLLAVPLLVYVGAAVVLAPQSARLQGERWLTVQLSSGLVQAAPPIRGDERVIPARSTVLVRIRVKNEGVGLSEAVIGDRRWVHVTSLPTGASSEWEYSFTPPRGRYPFSDLRVLAGDPFGLFAHELAFPAPVDGNPKSALLVLPETVQLRRVPVHPPRLSGYAGPVAARVPGSGTDFYGVREYQPGDSPRRLNWRLSSRHDIELYTNQFEGERYADIGLILDARFSRYLLTPVSLPAQAIASRILSGPFPDLFEYGVTAAASLGRAFLRDGQRVSLLVYGFVTERVPPGTGRMQIERLLRALAGARTIQNYALENLNYLPTRLFPPRSQIVFISPLSIDDFEALVRYRALGYDVLVIAPNPVHFEARVSLEMGGRTGDQELAVRLANIERELLIRRLARYGVWVVDWKVDRPLVEALRKGLAPLRNAQRMLRV